LWAFEILLKHGIEYDSSIFPVKHDFYGIPDWPRFAEYAVKGESGWQASNTPGNPEIFIRELPITTLRMGQKNLPIAGGGYFRLLPYAFTRWGLERINVQEQRSFVFYLHPWEFDPQQPRMTGAGRKSRFRHYLNLHKTQQRFERLLNDFTFKPIAAGLFDQ
jgi:polysaccharide deacetylase family protein (PEP-CTERM system associated)